MDAQARAFYRAERGLGQQHGAGAAAGASAASASSSSAAGAAAESSSRGDLGAASVACSTKAEYLTSKLWALRRDARQKDEERRVSSCGGQPLQRSQDRPVKAIVFS